MIIVRRMLPVLVVALGLALFAHPAGVAHADDPLQVEMTFSPQAPRCDGDSVRITLHVTHADGTPAVGVGTVVYLPWRPGNPGVDPGLYALTDRRGDSSVSFTPVPGTHGGVPFNFGVAYDRHSQWGFVPCPFSDDRSVVVNGTIWHDRNGNGVRAPGDQLLRRETVGIYGWCYGPGCFVPLHWTRTTRTGGFEWTGSDPISGEPELHLRRPGVPVSRVEVLSPGASRAGS